MQEALFYEKLDNRRVRCNLCPHQCLINEGKSGRCLARSNVGGRINARTYERMVTGMQNDPIEKKPLYHFYPGSSILSLAPNGCTLSCSFCQNWSIAQTEQITRSITPERAISKALNSGSVGLAYTYSEPYLWYEFLLEIAPQAREKGLKNVMVTNGYYEQKPFEKLLPHIDAFNIDLKAMDDDFYHRICKGSLAPVLSTIKQAVKSSHVELTNLVIPTLNDSDEQITRLIDWVADELGPNVPLHFSRYFPSHKVSLPPTPLSRLFEIRSQAMEKLNYVYLGNIGGMDEASIKADTTFCPHCHKPLIVRVGYYLESMACHNGSCDHCSEEVHIIQ